MANFIFWQNILSILQVALIRALAEKKDCSVTLIAAEEVPEYRLEMGWSIPDFGKTQVIQLPSEYEVDSVLQNSSQEDIHIFSGFRGFPLIHKAMSSAMSMGKNVGVFAESPDLRGFSGFLRKLLYRFQALHLRDKLNFILATGDTGVNWYKSVGYSQKQVLPFGYFVLDPDRSGDLVGYTNDRVKIVFVGSLIKRKGVDLLLKALQPLHEKQWELELVGDGEERGNLEQLVRSMKIDKKIHFLGSLTNEEATRRMGRSDLFVLPSRYDGWGAVVNEALMRGVPAICSSRCGAGCLLDGYQRGEVFSSENIVELTSVLRKRISLGPLTTNQRQGLREWALQSISGDVAAEYILDVSNYVRNRGPRPRAKWLSN